MQALTEEETVRQHRLLSLENALVEKGYSLIAGVDEAGRGPLAGPVVAASCILLKVPFIAGINDSKQLSEKKRREIYTYLTNSEDVLLGVGIVEAEEIDKLNIYQATILAMKKSVQALPKLPEYLLVDGLALPIEIPNEKIIKGDARSLSIAAASIVAKETRDALMRELDEKYPMYGFGRHKGYGTEVHRKALKEHGPCPEHRKSFSPVREALFDRSPLGC